MAYATILTEQRDNVLLITLNRPDRLNAWTPTMMNELTAAVGEANDDPSIGAIVMTGAGRGFCAGADMEAVFTGPGGADVESSAGTWVEFCRASKPMIAAINGAAIGVGITMVLPFDQIIAAEGAKISVRFAKLGIVPELASTHFLVSRCGYGNASWLTLSGETILADDARSMGLVDVVAAPDALLDVAMERARVIASNSKLATRLIKDLLTKNAVETDLAEAQKREFRALAEASASQEHRDAIKAFLSRGR